MTRLVDRFVVAVHPKNPVIQVSTLRCLVRHVGENGPDWSVDTCLVALVCALGALSMEHCPTGQFTIGGEFPSIANEISLAKRYWFVAEKRLGLAMTSSTSGWESTQCLCLAG